MFGIKKFLLGLKIVPKTTSAADAQGEFEVLSTDGKARYHNGTSVSPIVTESHTATVTNKTLVVANNTVTTAASGNLVATELNAALAELDLDIGNVFSDLGVHVTDTIDAHDASAISSIPAGSIAATDVQAAINELDGDIQGHITDAVDAHDASAISNTPAGNLAATDVQGALNELQTQLDGAATDSALQAHINDALDAHDASAISSIPAGSLAATDVQAAVNELDGDIQGHISATVAHGATGAVVGTTNTQTLTNKTITGADFRTPVRSDVKQDTKANLTTYALTASNGQLVFATDTKEMFQVVDTLLEAVGGGSGVGGVDILFTQTFEEAALTDFTQTGLSLSTSSPIHGAISALMTHQAGVPQSFKQVIAVDEKFRGIAMSIGLNIKSTATAGNVTILVYDETNAANILSSTQLEVSSDTAGVKDTVSFTIPATCLSMSYTITALQEAGSPVTRVDDIICQIANSSLLETSVTVPKVTAWVAYTPTFTGFGTATNIEFQWRQAGENVEIRGKFISGTSTAVEARVSLPNSYTSAGVSLIPSIQLAGDMIGTNFAGTLFRWQTLIEPSVSYMTFGVQSSTQAGFTKALGTNVDSAGSLKTFSLTASVPIQGLAATEDVTIPLTQSGIVQEADSYIKLDTFNTFGSTANKIARFINTVSVLGSDITYTDSVVNGASFTVNTDGMYSFEFSMPAATGVSSSVALSKNTSGADLTTIPTSLTSDKILSLSYTPTVAGTSGNPVAAWTGYLIAGDIVRPHTGGSTPATVAWAHFSCSKQGSLKQVTVNTNSKITIPTSELRFEGASARGAVATAIVKFDTLAKIRGDAFTVTNTANDGTYVTMNKAGKLDVSVSLFKSGTAQYLYITKNQAVLTAAPASASEILATSGHSAATSNSQNAVCSVFINIGDVIRVNSNSAPTATYENVLSFTFQEQDIQVSVSNTLPQFSESDSSVRVDTANGFGSTNTVVRRFSNINQNLGSDIVYSDSATLGASFTVMESGIYSISYYDSMSTASSTMGFVKNQTTLTDSSDDLARERHSATAGEEVLNAAWTGYLTEGDVVRPLASAAAFTNARVGFTMSKVGKPNVTGVDVTPFVNIPQPVSQSSYKIDTAGASLDLTSPTGSVGNGLYSVTSTTITANRQCIMDINIYYAYTATGVSNAAAASISRGGAFISTNRVVAAAATNILRAQASASVELNTGDTIDVSGAASGTGTYGYTITASGKADQILTAPETFSTDTAPLVYAGSGTYTLATLANAPVGTFITFTYAASTNTRTQTTTAPTQTTADMNTNGIQIFTRVYASASTAGSPAIVAIQLGKGLKGLSLGLYKSTGKTTSGEVDYAFNNAANTAQGGFFYKTYNEVTGILYMDSGLCPHTGVTTANFQYTDITGANNGYLTISASKNPALTGLNINAVAARGVNTAGTSIANAGEVTAVYDSNKTYDTHGALNTTTGIFTAPERGYYQISWNFWFLASTYAIGDLVNSRLYKNGAGFAYSGVVTADRAASYTMTTAGSTGMILNVGDTLEVKLQNNRTAGATTLSTNSSTNYFSIHKTSIG